MQVGIIGVGVVGGTLKRWFAEHTDHDVRCLDPYKNMADSLEGCSAIFISVPAPANSRGQDLSTIENAVRLAKQYTDYVFIRSTVLPGTNDKLKSISMPEFLTERRAYEDLCNLPVLVGKCDEKLVRYLFPEKQIIMVSNTEAELAKYTHNCFGAWKVSYFNIISKVCQQMGANFDAVKFAAGITGFIEPTHTQVPGPDGLFGYGGKCFPENMEAFKSFLSDRSLLTESTIFKLIEMMNANYRYAERPTPEIINS